MTSQVALHGAARALILVGAVILILGAILSFVSGRGLPDITPTVRSLGLLTGALVGVIVAILALVGASRVTNVAWDVILLVLGLFVGSLGGILVFIGALIGLVATIVKI